MSYEEEIRKINSEIERKILEISQNKFFEIPIDSYIDCIKVYCQSPSIKDTHRKRADKICSMARYLKEKYEASTYGEILKTFENRKISLNLMEMWIDEGYINNGMDEPITKGYPELSDLLTQDQKERKLLTRL